MPLTELVPIVQELSHSDKLLLLHSLVSDLLKESGLTPLDVEGKTASLGLHDSFEAAAILAKALAEEKATSHG
jgi:hypothetical protein